MDIQSCNLLKNDLPNWVILFLTIFFIIGYLVLAISYFFTARSLQIKGTSRIEKAAKYIYYLGFTLCIFLIIIFLFITFQYPTDDFLLLQIIFIPFYLLLLILYTAWKKIISLRIRYLMILGYFILAIPILSLGSIFFFEQLIYNRRVCLGVTCPVECSQLKGLRYK